MGNKLHMSKTDHFLKVTHDTLFIKFLISQNCFTERPIKYLYNNLFFIQQAALYCFPIQGTNNNMTVLNNHKPHNILAVCSNDSSVAESFVAAKSKH